MNWTRPVPPRIRETVAIRNQLVIGFLPSPIGCAATTTRQGRIHHASIAKDVVWSGVMRRAR